MVFPWILLTVSVALAAVTLVLMIVIGIVANRSLEGKLKTKGYTVPILVGGIVGALWCMHYAVGYFADANTAETAVRLSWLEQIGSSLLKTAKAVGVDENMDHFILELKGMLRVLQNEEHWLQTAFGLYAGFLYVLAPILGGIGLLEILAGVFPQIRLFFARFAWWQGKYYFSQLHDGSLELARGICQVDMKSFKRSLKRPVLIFTGVEVDQSDLASVKRLDEAKALGAICLRSDLKSTAKWGWGGRKFFLVEEDELEVLQQLSALTTEENCKYMDNAEVFFFVTSEAYVSVEEHIWEELKRKGVVNVMLQPVRRNFNLIKDLLTEVPLFEPLIGKKKNPDGTRELVVAILGAGGLGTEMLLNTYWLGQMLDCNLTIRVYSRDGEQEFWSKLDHVNPEIRQSAEEGNPILQICPERYLRAKPYCRILYQQCNLASGNLGDDTEGIRSADYCLVALGSDNENIAVAQAVSRCVGEYHVARQDHSKTVVAYVVNDPHFAQLLNRKKYLYYAGDKPDVYMLAMGSLPEIYSLRNVLATYDEKGHVEAASEAYLMLQDVDRRMKAFMRRSKSAGDGYNYWAWMARVLHRPYKLYSAGMLQTSLLDGLPEKAFRQQREAESQRGIAALKGCLPAADLCDEAYRRLLHQMAWLEHRRWNAFTRVMGYRYTNLYHEYWKVTNNHKHMPLKLHPCLVECDDKGIRAEITPDGKVDQNTQFQCSDKSGFDYLDALSYELHEKYGLDYDFKLYDYPEFDFGS